MAWDYGDEGRAFPVQPGEVWQCGQHVFMCSDLMASKSFDELINAPLPVRPQVLYCDPPWGQSLVNSFRTKAGLARATYRWEELYSRIAAIGHSRGLPVWIEGSVSSSRDGRKIPDTLKWAGTWQDYVDVTYYRTHWSGLYYSGPSTLTLELKARLRGKDDEETPGIVMDHYGVQGQVIDPCAGRGQTSRQAELVGWSSLNNELNPARLSAALVRMSKLVNAQPWRVS